MNSLRIIFMGTPEFAVPSLEILIKNNFNVVAVITAADKPQGRGQIMTPSPVKHFAVANGIPVLQPLKLKAPEFFEELKSYKADLQIVVAFRMLPESIWGMPRLGTFNLHASLLPQYRGAAPINWAIIRGEKETGATTFFLQQEIDTGNIIFQVKEPILDNDDAGSVHDLLMVTGANLVLKTTMAIQEGEYPSAPQDFAGEIKLAPKIFRETCHIEWNQPVKQVWNFVRGLSPYPAAWTVISGKTFKIFKSSVASTQKEGVPGEFTTDNKNYLWLKCADGWLSVEELQAEGKKRMTVPEFFMGNKL